MISQAIKSFKYYIKWKKRGRSSLESYWNDSDSLNRIALREKVSSLSPNAVFEYGVYSGANLKGLECQVYGCDINPQAIKFVREKLPTGNFAVIKTNRDLIDFLPEVDVTIVIATFYTIPSHKVLDIMRILAMKSDTIIIGCNFSGKSSPNAFLHDWEKIFSELSLSKIDEIYFDGDYALNGYITVKSPPS